MKSGLKFKCLLGMAVATGGFVVLAPAVAQALAGSSVTVTNSTDL